MLQNCQFTFQMINMKKTKRRKKMRFVSFQTSHLQSLLHGSCSSSSLIISIKYWKMDGSGWNIWNNNCGIKIIINEIYFRLGSFVIAELINWSYSIYKTSQFFNINKYQGFRNITNFLREQEQDPDHTSLQDKIGPLL